ncbi:hypothetical protein ZHAS_00011927 [Anopheles sinensis]|uniref:Uncharacterized protein n=1 Tax=Anopheles sinensis TaxID=74873 RepID=A0A084W1J8_ANOSI|nr:hypothetical protein ZHAS_00011927 [Anopheles sinensis]
MVMMICISFVPRSFRSILHFVLVGKPGLLHRHRSAVEVEIMPEHSTRCIPNVVRRRRSYWKLILFVAIRPRVDGSTDKRPSKAPPASKRHREFVWNDISVRTDLIPRSWLEGEDCFVVVWNFYCFTAFQQKYWSKSCRPSVWNAFFMFFFCIHHPESEPGSGDWKWNHLKPSPSYRPGPIFPCRWQGFSLEK